MTISYLKSHGGQVERNDQGWDLTWPDGATLLNVIFTAKEAIKRPAARYLTLEEPRIRSLAERLPCFVPGQPVRGLSIPDTAEEIQGFWSLWRIAIADLGWNRRRIMPLFLADNNLVFIPTARYIWDQLLVGNFQVKSVLDTETSQAAFERVQKAAEEHGKPIYDGLVQEYRTSITRERQKAEHAFAARRKTIERIGLPQVRNYRLNLLVQEERNLQEQLDSRTRVYPEVVPLVVIRVEGGGYE